MTPPPRIRAVGDTALLVEFGETVDAAVHARVVAFDAAVTAAPPAGVVEVVPAFCSVLVAYDPGVTDPQALESALRDLAADTVPSASAPREHVIPACYDGDHAPDLAAVAARAGLSAEAVIAQHLAPAYRVYMYGFAPGYAYLGGVAEAIRLPRKPAAVRGHPVGSILIAAGQCLVTTLPMPTGWWVIGRSPVRLLDPAGEAPPPFAPGDSVRFRRIDAAAFDRTAPDRGQPR